MFRLYVNYSYMFVTSIISYDLSLVKGCEKNIFFDEFSGNEGTDFGGVVVGVGRRGRWRAQATLKER